MRRIPTFFFGQRIKCHSLRISFALRRLLSLESKKGSGNPKAQCFLSLVHLTSFSYKYSKIYLIFNWLPTCMAVETLVHVKNVKPQLILLLFTLYQECSCSALTEALKSRASVQISDVLILSMSEMNLFILIGRATANWPIKMSSSHSIIATIASMTETMADAPNFSILDQISYQKSAIHFIGAISPKISTVQQSRRCKPHILQTIDVSKTPSSLILFWGLLKSHQCS